MCAVKFFLLDVSTSEPARGVGWRKLLVFVVSVWALLRGPPEQPPSRKGQKAVTGVSQRMAV
eukprot:2861426-Alexandrium_andersonii.AAC.1